MRRKSPVLVAGEFSQIFQHSLTHGKKSVTATQEVSGESVVAWPLFVGKHIVSERQNRRAFPDQSGDASQSRTKKGQPETEQHKVWLFPVDECRCFSPAQRIYGVDECMDL